MSLQLNLITTHNILSKNKLRLHQIKAQCVS